MKSYHSRKRGIGLRFGFGVLFVLATILPIHAQTIGDVPQPASPDGAALARNISIPMEYHTGRANVQIPLYTVQSRDLSIPITLTYQSSGIKVQDLPSWVGAGWNLSAGGKITRIVRGTPDEKKYLIPGSNTSLPFLLEHEPNWTVTKFNQILDLQNHYAIDGQPDVFYFEIPGKSGMFVFDPDGVAHTIPYQDIKVEWVDKEYFIITDENGNRFVLGSSDSSKELINQTITDTTDNLSITLPGHIFGDEALKKLKYQIQTQTLEYVSSWYLNSATSPTGEEITFQYDTTASYSYTFFNESTLYEVDGTIKSTKGKTRYTQTTLTEVKRPVHLRKILWRNGSLDFFVGASSSEIANMKILNSIEISTTGRLGKVIDFDYGMFGNKSPKLERITEKYLNNSSRPLCTFEYNEIETLPSRNSQDFDHWGYYNGNKGDTSYFAGLYYGMSVSFPCKNREADLRYAQASSLKAIVYPHGGRKEFEYELNEGVLPNGTVIHGGGLRISKITESETSTSEQKVTRYEYTSENGTTSGSTYPVAPMYLKLHSLNGYYTYYMVYNTNVNYISDINGMAVVYQRVKEILPNNASNVYTYYVDEDVPGTVSLIPADGPAQEADLQVDDRGLIPATTHYWLRGLPKETVQYDASGQVVMEKQCQYEQQSGPIITASYLTQMAVSNHTYDSTVNRCLVQYRYVSYPIRPSKIVTVKTPYSLPSTTSYVYGDHPLLPVETVTVDADGDTTRNRLRYAFDYFEQLPASSADTMVNALKEMRKLHMTSVPIETVTERNGRVMGGEITTYRTGMKDSTLVAHQSKRTVMERSIPRSEFAMSSLSGDVFTYHSLYRDMTTVDQYDEENNPIQSHDRYGHYKSAVYGYDSALPIAIVENAESCAVPSLKANEIFYTGFEDDGDLNYPDSEDTKTGRRVHRGSYSIPIEGFKAGTYTLTYWRQATQGAPWEFMSKQITVSDSYTPGSVTVIGQTDYAIDEVRIFPQGATMVTMTHDPNVGITSETDHNGVTKYYEYDGLGRLSRILNNDREVLESYEYKN